MRKPLPVKMLQAFYQAFPELAETPIDRVTATGFSVEFPSDAMPTSREVYACGTAKDGAIVPVHIPGLMSHRQVKARLTQVGREQGVNLYPYYVRKTVVQDCYRQEWTRYFWQPWKTVT